MSKVESAKEAVEEEVTEGLTKTEHIVKQEKTRTINVRYGWATEFNRIKFEESRPIVIAAETPYLAVYTHELLTQADLTHMVIFNAYNQKAMTEEEFMEILETTKEVLKKASTNLKELKAMKVENFSEMAAIYKRLKDELIKYGIVQTKPK